MAADHDPNLGKVGEAVKKAGGDARSLRVGAGTRSIEKLSGRNRNRQFIQSAEAGEIGALMARYQSIRRQLADAALVYLSERDGFDLIFTLDRRDFSVYEQGRKRSFRMVP